MLLEMDNQPRHLLKIISGLLILGVAAVLGMWMFFVRHYPLGYDVNKLLDYFERKA